MTTMVSGTGPAKSPYRLDGFREEQLDIDDEQKSLTRLRALLAQWLRMENVVVLCGAGTSLSQRGPLLSHLESFVLESVIDLCGIDPALKNCATLLTQRKKDVDGKTATMTFERWLSYLANAHFVLQEAGAPISELSFNGVGKLGAKELKQLLTYISQAIYLRCSLTLPVLHTSPTGHHALIAKLLARDPALGRASIFTTNYDTLIEQALDELAVQYMDGFVGTVKTRAWVIASVAIIALVILWYLNESATRRCAKRVSQIEKRINDLADEELLEWELKWGAVTTGYFPEWREVKARIVDCWRQAVSRLRRRQS